MQYSNEIMCFDFFSVLVVFSYVDEMSVYICYYFTMNVSVFCYVHNNRHAHLHDHPIHVRLFWMLQLVDNCRYQSCHPHVSWDHVLRIDSPRIQDMQMLCNTKLMQEWWTEMKKTKNINKTHFDNYILHMTQTTMMVALIRHVGISLNIYFYGKMQLRHLFFYRIDQLHSCITGNIQKIVTLHRVHAVHYIVQTKTCYWTWCLHAEKLLTYDY